MGRFVKQAAVVLCMCCLLVACKENKEDAQKYLEEGKTLLGQGKIEEARVQLQSALQIEPKLAEGYYLLALIDEKKQDWKGMLDNLQTVLGLDQKHVEAHLKLGKLYLDGHQFDKASEQATIVEQLQPDQVGSITLRAAISFLQKKNAEALEQVGRALVKDPANLDATMLQASIYALDGKNAEALATLNKGIQRHLEDIDLQLMKIRVEAVNKSFDAAVNDYRALIARHPDKKELNDGFIELLSGIGRPEQAEAVLREVVAKYPSDTGAKLKLIDFLGPRDAAGAEKTLKQFVEATPAEIALQFRLVDLYWSQKRYADAQAVLNHIIEQDKAGKEGLSATVKLARIALAQNDAKAAEALVDQVLATDNANSEALLLRAGFRLGRNEPDAAITDLRIVLKDHPNSDTALVMLAQAYRQNGAPDLAESNLRKALEVNPGNLLAALPLARKMIQVGELDRAEETVTKALKANPENHDVLTLLAQVRAQKKDWAGAQAAAAELGKLPKGSAAADWMSGVILAGQGNFKEAIKKYQASLLTNPESAEAIRDLAQAYVATGNLTGLMQYLKGFIEKNPKALEGYLTLARGYATEKKWDEAVSILDTALKADPKFAATYEMLAAVYAARNKPDDAVRTYRTGLAELPDNVALMMGLAQHYERVKDAESAITLYSELLKKKPTYDLAVNNLASLLADHRKDQDSMAQAAKLSSRFSASPNPLFLDTYGWVTLQSGNKDQALAALKQVVVAAPDVAIFRYHLGVAYLQASDKTAAKRELEKALTLGAEKEGEFTGVEQAKNLFKELADTTTESKSELMTEPQKP